MNWTYVGVVVLLLLIAPAAVVQDHQAVLHGNVFHVLTYLTVEQNDDLFRQADIIAQTQGQTLIPTRVSEMPGTQTTQVQIHPLQRLYHPAHEPKQDPP